MKDYHETGSAGKGACELIEIMEYSPEEYQAYTMEITDPGRFALLSDVPENHVRWINVDGQCAESTLRKLGEAFHIHPLVMNNLRNNSQRARIEEYNNFLSIVTKMIYYSGDELIIEHMNFILGPDYVITIGETRGDVFDDIRSQIESGGSHVRNLGTDFLMYLLLDAIVDGYFGVLEVLNEKIDELEEQIMTETSQEHLYAIREIKRTLLQVNKYVWPLRDVASLMGKESSALIRPSTEPYIRDVYDHIVQAIDSIEACRELISGLADLHISNTSYRLNEIMKVLTIISTIFIPLTFIVGVYGMNFKYMPELQYPWGYGVTWVVMLIISGLMLYYFKRKKWF